MIKSGKRCLRAERAIAWNRSGVQGSLGLQGSQGLPGSPGAVGNAGTNGIDGTNGTNGTNAATTTVVRTAGPVTVPAGGFGNATASCNVGERRIAGGVDLGGGTATIVDDAASGANTWFGQARGGTSSDQITVSVICASP